MTKAQGNTAAVIATMIGIMMLVLVIESCTDTPDGREIRDQDVIEVARERFEKKKYDFNDIEVIEEKVIRPGRNGEIFGYYLKYRRQTPGGWVEEDYYDE